LKIRVDRPVLTIEGLPFEPATSLRAALFGASVSIIPGDEKLSLEDKLKVHQLATKIHSEGRSDGVLELSVDELALVRRRAGSYFGHHVFGQVNKMLEGES